MKYRPSLESAETYLADFPLRELAAWAILGLKAVRTDQSANNIVNPRAPIHKQLVEMGFDQFVSGAYVRASRKMLQMVTASPEQLLSVALLDELEELFIVISHFLTVFAHVIRLRLEIALVQVSWH